VLFAWETVGGNRCGEGFGNRFKPLDRSKSKMYHNETKYIGLYQRKAKCKTPLQKTLVKLRHSAYNHIETKKIE